MRDKATNPMDDIRTSRYLRRPPSDARYGLQSYGPAPVPLSRRWMFILGVVFTLVAIGVAVWWSAKGHSAPRRTSEDARVGQPEPKHLDIPLQPQGQPVRGSQGKNSGR